MPISVLSRLKANIPKAELYTSLIIFVIYIAESLSVHPYSNLFYIQSAVYTIIFICYVSTYLIKGEVGRYKTALHIMFVSMLILFLWLLLISAPINPGQLLNAWGLVEPFGWMLVFLLPIYFLFALGAYVYRVIGNKKLGSVIFALGFSAMIILFGYVITQFRVNDEVFLGYKAVEETLKGMNPYTTSVSSLLYTNVSAIGVTVTANNAIVGTMDYPALYFLSYMPFYLATSPTLAGVEYVGLKLQIGIFLALFFLSVSFLIDKRDVFRFRPGLIIFIALLGVANASAVTFLMLALLVIAYARLESRYAFIPMGLAISIQQEVWIPVAFLLLYSLNNYGIRKSGRDALGALIVFLAVNAYFIILNPLAFFTGIMKSIGNIIPFGASPFSSVLLYTYHVGLTLSVPLIVISTLLLAALLLYWNRKELIPLFSMIPILFVFHSILPYYTFFATFLVVVICLRPAKKMPGLITRYLHRNRPVFYASVIALILIASAYTYGSHESYARDFGVNATSQSLVITGNNATYNAEISYSNPAGDSVYLFVEGYTADGGAGVYGFGNQSLIGAKFRCSSSGCPVNINRIVLNPYAHTYHLMAEVNWSNESDRVIYLDAILYNANYVYRSQGVYNSSTRPVDGR